jgi:hypothetical protein
MGPRKKMTHSKRWRGKINKRAAFRAPTRLRDIAASKFNPRKARRIKGTFGAASEVRKIDPKTWEE